MDRMFLFPLTLVVCAGLALQFAKERRQRCRHRQHRSQADNPTLDNPALQQWLEGAGLEDRLFVGPDGLLHARWGGPDDWL